MEHLNKPITKKPKSSHNSIPSSKRPIPEIYCLTFSKLSKIHKFGNVFCWRSYRKQYEKKSKRPEETIYYVGNKIFIYTLR